MPHWPVERRRLLSCLNLTTLTWVLDFDFLIDDVMESLDEIGRISDWEIRLLVSSCEMTATSGNITSRDR